MQGGHRNTAPLQCLCMEEREHATLGTRRHRQQQGAKPGPRPQHLGREPPPGSPPRPAAQGGTGISHGHCTALPTPVPNSS